MQLPRESQDEGQQQQQQPPPPVPPQHLQQPCQPADIQNLSPKHEEGYNNNNNGPNDVSLIVRFLLNSANRKTKQKS